MPRALGGGHHANGLCAVGEDIGDLGGLFCALPADRLWLRGRPALVIAGLTGIAADWSCLVSKEVLSGLRLVAASGRGPLR